jgi:tetratricopeptide (TPR) repeat protein
MSVTLRRTALLVGLAACLVGCRTEQERRAIEAHTENARYWYEHGDLPRARQQATRGLELDPDDEELLLLLGWIHLRSGARDDVWRAEEYFERLRAGWFEKEDYRAVLGHGISLRRQAAYLRAAADALEAGDVPFAGTDAEAEVERLRERAEERELRSIDTLERTLRLHTDNPLALDNLQQIYGMRGDWDLALARGTRFLDLAQQSEKLWRGILERPGLPADDERLARERIEENVQRQVATRGLLANVCFKQERYAQAAEHLDALLRLDPTRASEYLNRARCRMALGQNEGAREDLQEFLKRTPLPFEAEPVKQVYEWLRTLGGDDAPATAKAGADDGPPG